MLANPSLATPLSDAEFDALADVLDLCSPFDTDGLLGLLHAVGVAPSLLPPSTWVPVVFPDGLDVLKPEHAETVIGLLLRLHNDVLDALNHRQAIMPSSDDIDSCRSFASGYAAGAELDPLWIGDDNRWTFASHVAFLGGRLDLVPEQTLAKIQASPDTLEILRHDLGAIVAAAYDSFNEVRRSALSHLHHRAPAASPRATRVGRNEPCPCGSGKKYKRCCAGRAPTVGR